MSNPMRSAILRFNDHGGNLNICFSQIFFLYLYPFNFYIILFKFFSCL